MGYRWNNDNTIDFLLIQASIVVSFRFGTELIQLYSSVTITTCEAAL